jgi:hypothetical protein
MTATRELTWTHEGRPELNRMGIPAVDGPWMAEPDKVQWIDPTTDMDCLAVRNSMGAWCGYVGVAPGHPFHGVSYDQCRQPDGHTDDESTWCYEHTPNGAVEVHGGLTFAAFCHESDKGEGYGICHTPFPGREPEVWWLGFDCAHLGDLSPYDAVQRHHEPRAYWSHRQDDVYRDLSYVKAECATLAAQLAAVSA